MNQCELSERPMVVSGDLVVGEVGDAAAQPDNAAREMTLQNQDFENRKQQWS